MAKAADVLTAFLQSLKSGAPRADLLSEDARFQALNVDLKGRNEVLKRVSAEPTGKLYRDIQWDQPRSETGVVKVKGLLPGTAGGAILTVHFAGDRIAIIQQQGVPGAPRSAAELKLTPTIKSFVNNALATRHPMLIAYVDATGQPVVTFRGSTQAFSDDQLAIWIRNAEGSFISSIQKNPKVALMYRDEESKATYQFKGRARIASDAASRQQVYATMAQVERDHDFAQAGVAVVIDLDLVQGYAGLSPSGPIDPVRMIRGAGN